MCVAVVIQNAKRMCHIVTCALPGSTIFFTLSYERHDLREKVTEHKMCALVFSTTLSETFPIIRRIRRDITINVHMASCKVPVILVRFS
jgi:hypothetical protein